MNHNPRLNKMEVIRLKGYVTLCLVRDVIDTNNEFVIVHVASLKIHASCIVGKVFANIE